jgi:hypothetical protein
VSSFSPAASIQSTDPTPSLTDRSSSQDLESSTLRQIRSFIAFVIRGRNEKELIEFYLDRIIPAFPVLPSHTTIDNFEDLPLGLQAFVLTEALASHPEFRAAGLEARTMVKTARLADRMLETQSKLSSISAALLELNMNLDPRGDFLLLSKVRFSKFFPLHVAVADSARSLFCFYSVHRACAASRPSHRLSRLADTRIGERLSNEVVVGA